MKRGQMAAIGLTILLSAFSRSAYAQGASQSRRVIHRTSPQEMALHDLLVQAKAAADKQDYDVARADYEKYLAQKPDDAQAHFDLGYVFTALKQDEKAEAEYRKAVALNPKMAEAYLNLGLSLLGHNPKSAVEPLTQVTELNYSFARGHYLLGVAEERSSQSSAAMKEFAIAVKLDPKDFPSRLALASAELNGKNAAAAETDFREALRLTPGDPEAELGLAQGLAAQNKKADAAAELAQFLQAKPEDADARLLRASLLIDLGKNDDALQELDTLAKNGPESLEALKLRSLIDYREKKLDDAAAALRKAEALAPEDAEIRARLGHVLLQNKDYAGAARELNDAFRLDTKSTETLKDLLAAEYLSEDYPAALAALNVLDQRVPPTAGSWFIRGSCFDHMGQQKIALEAYQKFLATNTDQTSNQYFEATARVRFLQNALKDQRR
jgi:Flp pilus assembly protein TadD